MTKNDFIYEVTDRIRHRAGSSCEVQVKKVPYNNGQHLTGIILKKNPGVSPLIYLDKFYDHYVSGSMSMVEIVDEVVGIQEDGGLQELTSDGRLADYEFMRSKIRLRLGNYEANKVRLEKMPHVLFLDTAIMFYIEIDSNRQRTLTAAVEHRHLEMWGIEKERLYEDALHNMRVYCPVSIRPVMNVIKDIEDKVSEELHISMPCEETLQNGGFWIMAAEAGGQGSAALIYGNGLKRFAQLIKDDIVILPSSLHEVILIPNGLAGGEYGHFSRMVEEVNNTEILKEDRLSNSVYLYSRDNDSISIAHKGPDL